MPTVKESLWPIIAIVVASTILIVAIMPLAQTEWAEGFRLGLDAGGSRESLEAGGEPSGIFGYIGSFIKITLFMGIPGLLTIGVRKLTNGNSSKKKA